jgi:hypothetical protein
VSNEIVASLSLVNRKRNYWNILPVIWYDNSIQKILFAYATKSGKMCRPREVFKKLLRRNPSGKSRQIACAIGASSRNPGERFPVRVENNASRCVTALHLFLGKIAVGPFFF